MNCVKVRDATQLAREPVTGIVTHLYQPGGEKRTENLREAQHRSQHKDTFQIRFVTLT